MGNEVKVQDAISSLRALVSGEKNLKVRMDDGFMLRYLRASEFKPKEAFDKMVKLYEFKEKHADFFCNKSLSDYQTLLSQNFFGMLEERDQTGRRLLLFKMGEIDVNRTSFRKCLRLIALWMELLWDEEETQKNGATMVVDMDGLPMRLLRFITPKDAIICARMEEMKPCTPMDFHVVKTSRLLNVLIALVFPFLGSKIKQHIHFHDRDWTSLHKFISPDDLPTEYGGHKPEVDFRKSQQFLYDNEDKIKEMLSMGYVKS
jgi:hypothetical protein